MKKNLPQRRKGRRVKYFSLYPEGFRDKKKLMSFRQDVSFCFSPSLPAFFPAGQRKIKIEASLRPLCLCGENREHLNSFLSALPCKGHPNSIHLQMHVRLINKPYAVPLQDFSNTSTEGFFECLTGYGITYWKGGAMVHLSP